MAQHYDIDRFLEQVQQLLRDNGIEPEQLPDQPNPVTAGSMLLRAYGLVPVADQVKTLSRAMDKIWSDEDELYDP